MTSAMDNLPRELDKLFPQVGAAAWGAIPYASLIPWMSGQARVQAESRCPDPATVLVAAFPYYAGAQPGNLSLYARGEDYHRVLGTRLNTVCDFLRLKYSSVTFWPGTDSSPLPERRAAWLAGIGMEGKNGLLLLPPYGSYVFLGCILTNQAFSLPLARPAPPCTGCGRCLSACPSGALTASGVRESRCLSHLTQYKGSLTWEEEALLEAHPLVWGCDICQQVCPYNAIPVHTSIPEFVSDPLETLTAEMLDGLTNRTFQEKYGHRAFAWRGPAVLRRNLALKRNVP